jgi:hypothetical protein
VSPTKEDSRPWLGKLARFADFLIAGLIADVAMALLLSLVWGTATPSLLWAFPWMFSMGLPVVFGFAGFPQSWPFSLGSAGLLLAVTVTLIVVRPRWLRIAALSVLLFAFAFFAASALQVGYGL